MNPVLLKPTGERASQVVVMGRPIGVLDAGRLPAVQADARRRRRRRTGRRSARASTSSSARAPAARPRSTCCEHDLVNLGLAAAGRHPGTCWSGDIERGGVFAHLFGTVALLPDELSSLVQGFVINRFRGDRALLGGATTELEDRCGVPTLGVLPHLGPVWSSTPRTPCALSRPSGPPPPRSAGLDVAAIRLPRLSNFTDLDPLVAEPDVHVRWVDHAGRARRARPRRAWGDAGHGGRPALAACQRPRRRARRTCGAPPRRR